MSAEQQNAIALGKLKGTIDEAKQAPESKDTGGGAVAISGLISNLTPADQTANKTGKIPFIAFRGSKSVSDIEADILTTVSADFKLPGTNQVLAKTSEGILLHFNGLMDLRDNGVDMLESIVGYARLNADAQNPPVVYLTGHSLGGCLAVLAGVTIRTRHPDVHVNIVTFGCPKVFTKDSLPGLGPQLQPGLFNHYRFVNDGNLHKLCCLFVVPGFFFSACYTHPFLSF